MTQKYSREGLIEATGVCSGSVCQLPVTQLLMPVWLSKLQTIIRMSSQRSPALLKTSPVSVVYPSSPFLERNAVMSSTGVSARWTAGLPGTPSRQGQVPGSSTHPLSTEAFEIPKALFRFIKHSGPFLPPLHNFYRKGRNKGLGSL